MRAWAEGFYIDERKERWSTIPFSSTVLPAPLPRALTCDMDLCFDGSVVFCGIAEWSLYGFVKGFVDGWGDHWQKIPVNRLVELEESGRLDRE